MGDGSFERDEARLDAGAGGIASGNLLRFVPLGGLGEIGMNCFALEQGAEILVVDCGIAFPDDDVGVDVIVPDFTWLVENSSRIVGLFITHGHEDHIGAVPHLLERLGRPIEIFAPTHACALLATRFDERGLDTSQLRQVQTRQRYPVGSFTVEPVSMAHSIIDATGLCIETRAGIVFHTGDFDFDAEQPAGQPTDTRRLEEIGAMGVRMLLSDSTNVDRESREGSEGDVARALREIVASEEQRVVVAMFSSNVHRLQALSDIAQGSGRRLAVLGRSLERHIEAARAIGRLEIPAGLLLPPGDLSQVPRSELLVIAGGSQGEAASSLRRLSLDEHPRLRLLPGDAVLMSARVIPGNERAVYRMQNDFLRLGVHVRTRVTNHHIHVSGHAARSEQRRMLELLKPASFVPVHGTLHHLLAHERLAREVGVQDCLTVENGRSIMIEEGAPLRLGARVKAGHLRIAFGGRELDSVTRRRRLELARNGVLTVALALDPRGRLVGAPRVSSLGLPGVDDEPRALSLLASDARAALGVGGGTAAERVRRALRRTALELSGVRPVVEVSIIELGRTEVTG